ncbi:NPCBM/NEW2 domain-containing protein [Streptomyces sp. ISL-44]|uniref:NPCBM/NEW2 domain-containing protein n=1 Tax=Streptomyces sp. ISL-44 TaxID=2819184 RepID=UPI002552C04B|nr:NPCBM/NEW2 domain-containing protein [Streptomyces sp. ISL-44]
MTGPRCALRSSLKEFTDVKPPSFPGRFGRSARLDGPARSRLGRTRGGADHTGRDADAERHARAGPHRRPGRRPRLRRTRLVRTETVALDVDVRGVRVLRLVVEDANNKTSFDHTSWALARVTVV